MQTLSPEIMHQLQQAITRWHLVEDGLPFQTPTSVLQCVLAQGNLAILKVALCAEEHRGAALLRWWNGKGAFRVLAVHENVALLERACGRQSLAALLSAGKTHGGPFRETACMAKDLLAAPQDVAALHGDVHHENILDAGERGWLAIDPKGLIGERGFDFANLFCNPNHHTATQPGRLARQVEVVSEAAGLEPKRLLAWVAAWAGLSATWHLEDGGSPETTLAVADLALKAS